MTPAQLTALASEIRTDPLTYGYGVNITSGNDQAIADLLNKVRDGTDGKAAITVRRPDCTPAEILEAIDVRDFPAAPTGVNNIPLAQSWLESITQFSSIRLALSDGTKTTTRKNIDRLVGDTQGSQTRLDAVAIRNGSRAEQLFGFGVRISSGDVAASLGRP
jgi:hypothetical protein